MSIPKGATHTSAGHYYRKTLMEWLVFGAGGWEESACHPVWLAENAEPIFDDRKQVLDDLVRLIETADANDKTLAEAIYDAGYRKFEIVEEDV